MGVILVVVACISFVYRNYTPMVTLAGVVLVPIGGIIFAEHHIFERLGMTKFWAKFRAKFREVRNYPAIFAWIIALVAAGLMYLAGIPYYFIFAPAWVVSIVAYTLLARRAGAAESYPDAKADEDLYFERALKFRDEEALKRAAIEAPDKTMLSRILLGLCMGSSAYFSIQFGRRDDERMKNGFFLSFVLIGAVALALTAASCSPGSCCSTARTCTAT